MGTKAKLSSVVLVVDLLEVLLNATCTDRLHGKHAKNKQVIANSAIQSPKSTPISVEEAIIGLSNWSDH